MSIIIAKLLPQQQPRIFQIEIYYRSLLKYNFHS